MNLRQERRLGKFRINNNLLWNYPEFVMKILSEFLIVRAEMLFHENVLEYIAYSHLFEIVPDTEDAPMYNIVIKTTPVMMKSGDLEKIREVPESWSIQRCN